ncbi:hypothetical protein GUJ93_ZPchr0011g27111 [Zizania palustris]|uniref:CASP-like protein n=1 Tax=Zizania palustris TaxID=103762 RepID=A0A8J5WKX7_ZIZPA|nr:hypothetical protein GUJ93_ZPchr0011g27111 [Zizania palustris]
MGDGDKKESGGGIKCQSAVSVALRIAAMGVAVASAVLMVTASECTVFLYYGGPPHTVTYRDFAPFVYLVVANFIAAFMEGIAIFLSICNICKKGSEGKPAKVLLPLLDVAVPALLYSATGAAFAAAEYLSYCSPNGGRRISVCSYSGAGNFCNQVHTAMYISLTAAAIFSAAVVVMNWPPSGGGGGDKKPAAGSDSESDSGCSEACNHGCHSKH